MQINLRMQNYAITINNIDLMNPFNIFLTPEWDLIHL